MNAHRFIRRLHLVSSFVLLAFVVMYFVTGFVLTHGGLLGEATEQVARRTQPFPEGVSKQPAAAAFGSSLGATLGLRGKPSKVERRKDGTGRVSYFHPGHLTEVTLPSDLGTMTVEEKRFGWQRLLIGLHRLHGYGGDWVYDIWAAMLDLASASMILFAVTGVLLWHRLSRDHRPGWIVLAAGFLLTASTVTYLILRR